MPSSLKQGLKLGCKEIQHHINATLVRDGYMYMYLHNRTKDVRNYIAFACTCTVHALKR